MKLKAADRRALEYAVQLLESENFLIRITSIVGHPIEKALDRLPRRVQATVNKVTDKALRGAFWFAARTTRDTRQQASWDKLHKLGAAASGAAGGWFGMIGAAIEIPFSTTLMLRSILDIARSEGADLASPGTRIECLNVFALGGPSSEDDDAETSYFAVRTGLASLAQRAASYLGTAAGEKSAAELAGKMTAYLAQIAGRYAPIVGQKLAAESVPFLGAAAGAVINLAFIDHFQDKARGHFIVLRLEKQYGTELIRSEYEIFQRGRTKSTSRGRRGKK